MLQLIDLNLNQIFQCCHLDPKQIIHKIENKLKELYEERFWSEISKSSRLGYLYTLLEKEYKLEQYVEDLFYHKYRSSVARLKVSAHFFPIETGRMMNKPRKQRMCPFCLNKQIGDEHHYIFMCTHPKFIPIRTKLYEAISELAGQKTYRYESTQDLLLKLLSDKTLSASPRISKLLHTLLETYNNIAKTLVF